MTKYLRKHWRTYSGFIAVLVALDFIIRLIKDDWHRWGMWPELLFASQLGVFAAAALASTQDRSDESNARYNERTPADE